MANSAPGVPDGAQLDAIRSRIQHVFVLMLENRSFDHMFAFSGIPGINAATSADCNTCGATRYTFQNGAPDQMPSDPGHEFEDVVEQLCGATIEYPLGGPYPKIDNSGFAANYAVSHTEGNPPALADVDKIMRGIDTKTQTSALHQLASQFVLCDAWHSSLPGPTWPNRYFVHGASSAGLDHSPTKAELEEWETIEGFTYPKGSIFDALGSGNYRLYHDTSGPILGHIPQVSSLKGISFFEVHPLAYFEPDLQLSYPYKYTFIEPSYGDVVHNTYEGGSSLHPMDGLREGDQLVARVYNAIRKSPLWKSSLLIITFDEHGGFYDSVPPGSATPPNDNAAAALNKNHFDFSVLGVRVPAVIVSPWVAKGVDHTPYDHSSVLATLERLFAIAPLTDRDRTANDLLSLITSTCRKDCPGEI
jgi:phospholipase C